MLFITGANKDNTNLDDFTNDLYDDAEIKGMYMNLIFVTLLNG